ncbi:hypothetical protein A2533_02995 [Candidatus Falkowbacteria bacterium RIFOXYD2_FULL_35_9]|uniref:Uncharacterized protein n=1 Tax=Candidatus Falkowbacteria bacterium RIFOXYC2_FULL_36_12 TaxID=1798002 RepID=A0A1F5SZL7_9BACT|nr:MAG: hypothetical protein A2300_00260 [Candidatus Falkowbacteria bacterium RIFOXYB2_FULL_35_7]OGF31893.1 MAG: hypothetical protein A2478_05425 [Candidatus Falkowbacteria bacterium RIFOXYC2_FULL_36_12]OGF33998.1 MAG: hypothetical protein A2223_01815 [Candidatus Falkowbacteria bacterium RIFOXYA2_FULL_35_8]OGF47720.1 MAG: hypothetical protein A2533_02995 [Candidatus Falkowbacteria bacterium RIFOXYD2_FULL_35_9]
MKPNGLIGLVLILLGVFMGMIILGTVEDDTTKYISASVVFVFFTIIGINLINNRTTATTTTTTTPATTTQTPKDVVSQVVGMIILLALLVATLFAFKDIIGCMRDKVIPATQEFNSSPYPNTFSKTIWYGQIPAYGKIVNIKSNIVASQTDPFKFSVTQMDQAIYARMEKTDGTFSDWIPIKKNNAIYKIFQSGTLQAKLPDCASAPMKTRFLIIY